MVKVKEWREERRVEVEGEGKGTAGVLRLRLLRGHSQGRAVQSKT